MANYHLELSNIRRSHRGSIAGNLSYICGERVYDKYFDKTYYNHRKDVVAKRIYLPVDAPKEYKDLQLLCDAINDAEKRWDARTGRQLIGSLPNELPPGEWIRLIREFLDRNFVTHGLCAIAAIHWGRNPTSPSRNNPHVHMIITTRTIGPEGFNKSKDREHNKKEYLHLWRKQWADVQNRAYERNRLDTRVSHESLRAQELNREPTIHLSRADWRREMRGEQTKAGERKRQIKERNQERRRELEMERTIEQERSR